MRGLSLPDKIEDALSSLAELVRRAVDGTVPPMFVDYENQRVLIRSTTASAATSQFEIALALLVSTGGNVTALGTQQYNSTANFRSAVNVSGNTLSSGTSNWTSVTAGGLNIASTANFRSAVNVTGELLVNNWITASALQVNTSAAIGTALSGGSVKINSLYANNIVKGWVNYDNITPTVNDSFNVSSVSDNSLGNYTVNWDLDFANTNYAVGGMVDDDAQNGFLQFVNMANGSTNIRLMSDAGALFDSNKSCILAIGQQ